MLLQQTWPAVVKLFITTKCHKANLLVKFAPLHIHVEFDDRRCHQVIHLVEGVHGSHVLVTVPITKRPRLAKMLLLGGCTLVLSGPWGLSGVSWTESSPSMCSSVTSDSSMSKLPNFFIFPRMEDMMSQQSVRKDTNTSSQHFGGP